MAKKTVRVRAKSGKFFNSSSPQGRAILSARGGGGGSTSGS